MTCKPPGRDPHHHFRIRFRERFGHTFSARQVWRWIIDAYQSEDWTRLQFIARIHRSGRRIFRFDLPDSTPLFVVIDCPSGVPVTVMPEGWEVRRSQGRNTVTLGTPPLHRKRIRP